MALILPQIGASNGSSGLNAATEHWGDRELRLEISRRLSEGVKAPRPSLVLGPTQVRIRFGMTETRPAPPPSLDPDVVRVVAFIACGLLVSVKADGRFPLPESLSETTFQLFLLPYTLALVGAVAAFLGAHRAAPLIERVLARRLLTVSPVTWALVGVVGFELLTLVVLRGAARRYAQFGYALPALALLALALPVGIALIAASWRGRADGVRLFVVASGAYLASQILSMTWFPLHSGRSDMLPLIAAAVRRLVTGANPYGLYEIPHSVPLTYLPGAWLPFVPAVAFGLDPRVVQSLTTLAALALLVFAAPPSRRSITGCLAALFLFAPYVQYRHEIYLGTLWLSLALTAFLHARGLSRSLGLALGWAVATSQFVWVILPVYVVQLYRKDGARRTVFVAATSLATSLILAAPFLVLGPQEFGRGVFGHWERTLNVTTANLSYFVVQFASFDGLRLVQAAAWLAALIVALKRLRPADSPWGAMAAVLGVFVLFNSVVWVYFYLTVFFVMVMSVALDDRANRGQTLVSEM